MKKSLSYSRTITTEVCHGGHCLKVRPNTKYQLKGRLRITRLVREIQRGDWPGLVISNGYDHYNLYALLVCVDARPEKKKRESQYSDLVECFDDYCYQGRPRED